MKRKSLYFTATNRVEILEEPMPLMTSGQMVVETLVSGISAGTELLFYRNQVPASMTVDDEIDAVGRSPVEHPLKYGYATVGRVIEVGASIDSNWRGRRVFAFNPHETHFVAGPEELIVIPESLSADAACLLPTMETAVSLLQDARPEIGEQVAVFGLGMVGLLCTALLSEMPLGRLVGIDTHPLRREHAVRLGSDAAIDPTADDCVTRTREALGTRDAREDHAYRGADLVFELSGNPAALEQALQVVGYNGRIVVGSWYGDKPVVLSALGERFHRDHVRIQSSQVSRIDPRLIGRWTKTRRFGVAIDALRKIDVAKFVTHRIPLEDAGDAFALLDTRPDTALQVLLTHSNS